jgi:hypothetical protein
VEVGPECIEARGDEVRGHAEEDSGVEDVEARPGEAEVDKLRRRRRAEGM